MEPFETVQQLRPRAARVLRTATTRSGWSSATATAPRPPSARRSRRAPERLHDYRERSVQETRSGTKWITVGTRASPSSAFEDRLEPDCTVTLMNVMATADTESECP